MGDKATRVLAIILVAFSLGWALVFCSVSAKRDVSPLETALFQSFALVSGLAGSFLFGRVSARSAALDAIRPHARSAFRRVLFLYASISRLAAQIEAARRAAPHPGLEVLKAIVTEQIATAGDAMEDWNDIVPEEVAEIRARAEEGLALQLEDADDNE